MFYGANLHVNSMNVYMCDRHWQYSCLRHMKWALKWTILLTSILEPNFDIYSLVTYILLLKNIFSEIVVYFQKSYPNINGIFTCASIFEQLSSPSNHITPKNQLGPLGGN
jgi:hypothetical protein